MIKQDIAEAEIRAALERMAESEMFRDSPQLAAFLRFVTEAKLRGESDRIKGYTIGVEALGRGKDFDPQIDPIVRVEATRLRRTIERYYAGPAGAGDPVIITLSPGSYVPSFRLRKSASPISERLAAAGSGLRRTIALGLAVLAVATALAAYYLYPRISEYRIARSLQPGNGMPTVLLEPLAVAGTPLQDLLPQEALIEKLRDAISRFDTLNVALPKDVAGAEQSGLRRQIRFRLTGIIEYRDDGRTHLRFQLFDAADNRLVWSRLFERFAASGGWAASEDAVVTEVVTILAQPFGVIRAYERNRYLATGLGDPRYNCILEAADSLRSFDRKQHLRGKQCLESLTAADPTFTAGLSLLALIYMRDYSLEFSARRGDPAALDDALRVARLAIERQPESSRAYQMLFAVLFARKEIAPAFAAGEKAIALNKYDMTVLSDYGGRLILVGEINRGLEMLERAGSYGAIRPTWYNFYLFLGNYLKGDRAAANHFASQIIPENYPLGHVAHALAAHDAGSKERAREALLKLVALHGNWRNDPAGELQKFIPSEAIVQRLVNDLRAAGLSPTLR